MAEFAFLGVAAGLSAISGGINAADSQKKICQQTDQTYKDINQYCAAQSKLASKLRCWDKTLKDKIFEENQHLADITKDMQDVQKSYQQAYNNLELIVVFICGTVMILLILKRFGFLQF